jgi:hypothetical protein
MELSRRHFALALAALPAGCAIQPLPALRTEVAAAPAGTIALRPPALGQRWTYRHTNGYNSALLATQEHEVVALAPRVRIRIRSDAGPAEQEEQQQPWGQIWRETGWDEVLNYEQAVPLWPAEPTPGARSAQRTHYRIDDESYRYWISRHSTVQGWERVTLAGGSQLALRIDTFIRLQHRDVTRTETTRRETLWLAPEIGRWVAREVSGEYLLSTGRGTTRGREAWQRWELLSWT